MKTFWLSFCDPAEPEGHSFLGVAIVDVMDEDAASAKVEMRVRHPLAAPGAEWLWAALQKAHVLKINPGGAVAAFDITSNPVQPHLKHLLLSADDLRATGLQDKSFRELLGLNNDATH